MKYTLRQLEVFLAVSHHENITRAAEELSMSQSAASGSLQDLERQFDIQLFDRVGKRLRINELGQLLRPRAEALLEQARELERGFLKHAEIGPIKVGATLTIGNYLALTIMAEFMRLHPGVRVGLEVANTTTIAARVSNFELDIGLIEGDLQRPELEVIPWREDELVVFCAPDHPLASGVEPSETALIEADWILREQGSGTRQHFERAMHDLLPQLKVLLELQHTEAIKRAVETGLGVGCLSQVTLIDAFRHGTLVPVPLPDRDFRRRLYFILHREKFRSAGIEQWMALCLSMAGAAA